MKNAANKPAPKPITLKPCPFCGSTLEVQFVPSQELCECEDEKTEGWFVICNASGGHDGCGSSSGWHKLKRGAAACWNKRLPMNGDRQC